MNKLFTFFLWTFFILTCFAQTVNTSDASVSSPRSQIENLKPDSVKTIYVIYESKEKSKSGFDIVFSYLKEILGSIVALIGIFLALPILKRKLIENHITAALSKIQDGNKVVQRESQKLIDKYVPLTFSAGILSKDEINNVFEEIKTLFYLSQDGSSDVVSFLFYLKITLQGSLKHIDSTRLLNRDFYLFVIDILQTTNFYCSQVVQIPKSTATETSHLINKSLRKFVTHADFLTYKHFNLGVIEDPHSAHYTIFYGKLNRTGVFLMSRAAFQIYFHSAPIKKLLYLNQYYAPSTIEMDFEDPFSGASTLKLYLIGFKPRTNITLENRKKSEIVELVYANPDDLHLFALNLKFEVIREKFRDTSLAETTFDLAKAFKMSKGDFETLTLVFEEQYLKQQFKDAKGRLKAWILK